MNGGEKNVATGTVKFFNANKGFGFIRPEGGGGDVFVHARDVTASGVPELTEGMRVGFELTMDPRKGKTRATKLRIL